MATQSPPPLTGIRVLEFAGLAPGPFAGLLLSDYGASVLRIDRPSPSAHSAASPPPPPTSDLLTRRKTSIALDLKSPASLSLLLALLPNVDILIDPFRPGVLERLGLPPTLLLQRNPRLIIARMTGFRRSGKYKDMAGHDINYLAVSGILSMIGPKAPGLPLPPGNILADFAGGGAMCFLGILLALFSREKTGKGQVVEANMVDGAAYLGTMPRLGLKSEIWRRERGENTLDGGCPYYGTYACKDGGIMSVGALEPQFFALLLKGLGLSDEDILVEKGQGGREDRRNWPHMKQLFTNIFLSKTRREWEDVFDGTDACVAPVLFFRELESAGYEQKVPVDLVGSPGLKVESEDGGWSGKGLSAGVGGEETLRGWVGWERGKQYEVERGALVLKEGKSKL